MGQVWLQSALWIGLALIASIISIRVAVSVALIEIMVGALAGNAIGLPLTEWVNFLAGFGAILLTFLAGTEIDPGVVRRHFRSAMTIGVVGFFAPYLGVLVYAHYAIHWPWDQAQIAGISLSTTSVAVVYAVMIETGFNRSEMGKIILAACFVNDLGTVLALGVVFAHYDMRLAFFGAATAVVLFLLPRFAPWFFAQVGNRVSEPETKFVALILLGLGGLAAVAGSEAVLPAYLVGMALAPAFLLNPELPHRMRIIAFTILTPFYFLKAGSLVDFRALVGSAGLVARLPRHQDGDQVRRHPAADPGLPLRSARGHVHHPADVDRSDVRHDLRAVRPDQPHHRPRPVHGAGDRGDRQRGRADADRPALVHAGALRRGGPRRRRADAGGGGG